MCECSRERLSLRTIISQNDYLQDSIHSTEHFSARGQWLCKCLAETRGSCEGSNHLPLRPQSQTGQKTSAFIYFFSPPPPAHREEKKKINSPSNIIMMVLDEGWRWQRERQTDRQKQTERERERHRQRHRQRERERPWPVFSHTNRVTDADICNNHVIQSEIFVNDSYSTYFPSHCPVAPSASFPLSCLSHLSRIHFERSP